MSLCCVVIHLLLCYMSLCWMLFCWVSLISHLCWVSLCWVSLYRVSLWWVSLCWVSLCWVSLCPVSQRHFMYRHCFVVSYQNRSAIFLNETEPFSAQNGKRRRKSTRGSGRQIPASTPTRRDGSRRRSRATLPSFCLQGSPPTQSKNRCPFPEYKRPDDNYFWSKFNDPI